MLPPLQQEGEMLDVVYILVTVAFFGLMAAYVRACEKLGQDGTADLEKK